MVIFFKVCILANLNVSYFFIAFNLEGFLSSEFQRLAANRGGTALSRSRGREVGREMSGEGYRNNL